MKQFERCWENTIDIAFDVENDTKDKAIARGYWKEALEWISNDCCPEAWDVGDIEDDIEEELRQL